MKRLFDYIKNLIPLLLTLTFFIGGCVVTSEFALRRLMGDNVDEIVKSLDDKDENMRGGAAWRLGDLGDRRGVDPLVKALKDSNGMVRRLAVEALRILKDKRAIEALIVGLDDEDVIVRRLAARALREFGDERAVAPLIKALGDSDLNVRRWAALGLDRLKDRRAVEALIKTLEDDDEGVRRNAAGALGEIHEKAAVEPLLKALSDMDGDVRKWAVWPLGEIGDERAVVPLIKSLDDGYQPVREYAIGALRKLRTPSAIDAIIKKGLVDDAEQVREDAKKALINIGDPALDRLSKAIRDEKGSVRRAAEASIKNIKGFEVLLNALKSDNPAVRKDAVQRLGKTEVKRAVEPLVKALADRDESVQESAKEALVGLKDYWGERLKKAISERNALIRQGAIQLVGKTEGWGAEEMKGVEAEAAGRIREAVSHYISAIRNAARWSEEDRRIREKVISIIVKLDPPPVIPDEAKRRAASGGRAFKWAVSREDIDKAAKEFFSALDEAPWWAEMYFNLAVTFETAGRYGSALESYNWYLLSNPGASDSAYVQKRKASILRR